jgi:ABC-2 type transport system ATP-binding protein
MTGRAARAAAGSRPAAGPGEWGARGVTVRAGGAVLLDSVSLAVPAGDVTAVVGGDGAGKTTLLRCLAGALAATDGEVATPGPARTGYLPGSSGIYPDLTVEQNLAFRAEAYGLPAAAARTRAAELTDRAGLSAARDRLAGQLSGGMRQKLGVICALLHEPDLLVLDEPTTGVDPVSRAGLWQLMAGAAAAGTAVVLSTTYLAEAQRAAAVLVLDGGRALAAGTPEEITAALPGVIVTLPGPPAAGARSRSWRRDGRWRTWVPPGAAAGPARPVEPDLQDAVTVAALARELADQPGWPLSPEDASPAGMSPAGTSRAGTSREGMSRAGTSRAGTRPAGTSWAGASPAGASQAAGPRPAAGTGPLAECTAVTRRFGAATAVRDVSLEVGPGEIVGLLGANGAGKTTLIRMLLGLLPATAGTIELFGAPPSRESRRRLGYVPQGLGLYDDLTVAENLSFSAAVFGGPPAELPVGLQGRAAVPVGALPLGLQRQAAFAQALAHRPDLLILDEPTSGVAPLGRARLWETIRAAAEGGAGILVTTHYMEEAGECDRLVVLAGGRVVAGGTPAEVIGAATVTVVTASAWRDAFRQLAEHGLAATLAGTTLRVPAAGLDQVRQALAPEPPGGDSVAGEPEPPAGGSPDGDPGSAARVDPAVRVDPVVRVDTAPATLEERFFQLVQADVKGG